MISMLMQGYTLYMYLLFIVYNIIYFYIPKGSINSIHPNLLTCFFLYGGYINITFVMIIYNTYILTCVFKHYLLYIIIFYVYIPKGSINSIFHPSKSSCLCPFEDNCFERRKGNVLNVQWPAPCGLIELSHLCYFFITHIF